MVCQLGMLVALVIVEIKFEICLSLCPSALYNFSPIMETGGICYEIILPFSFRLSWGEAKLKCAANKGRLAKITRHHVIGAKGSDLREFLSGKFFHYCIWIAMSDLDEEGSWNWLDGTPVTKVTWEQVNPVTELFRKWFYDCGALCYSEHMDGGSFTWRKFNCQLSRGYLCEYKALSSTTSPIAPTIPGDKNEPKNRHKEAVKKRRTKTDRYKEAVKKTRTKTALKVGDGYRVAGPPVFSTRTHSVSMCLRLCVEECRYFNYNLHINQCEGFTEWRKTDLHVDKDDVQQWEFWEIRCK